MVIIKSTLELGERFPFVRPRRNEQRCMLVSTPWWDVPFETCKDDHIGIGGAQRRDRIGIFGCGGAQVIVRMIGNGDYLATILGCLGDYLLGRVVAIREFRMDVGICFDPRA